MASGRKRDYAGVRVTLSKSQLAAIDAEKGELSRPAWIAELVCSHLKIPRRRRLLMTEAAWPALPDPNPVEPGTDLRTTRKGKFHGAGQRYDLEAQLRQVAAVRLKSEGKTYEEIAELLGFSTAVIAASAIKYAMRKYAAFEVREYGKVVLAEHFRDLERIQETIDHPGFRTDIKGDLVTDPDGLFMEDEQIRLAALTEKRKTLESVRRMTGTDEPKRTEHMVRTDEDLNKRIAQKLADLEELRNRMRPVASLPDDYDDDIVEADLVEELVVDLEPESGDEV